MRQIGIVGDQLFFRLAGGEKIQNQLDSQTRTAHYGLPGEYFGIGNDALSPLLSS